MNSVTVIGRLTRDPELRHTDTGTEVCEMRLAIPERKERTVYVSVVTFNGVAAAAKRHLGKGRRVGVSGRLAHDEWTDAEGAIRSKLYLIANSFDFADSRPNGEREEEGEDGEPESP